LILDVGGEPATGVTIVGGLSGIGTPNHRVVTTDKDGRFSWPIPPEGGLISLFAHRPGRSIATWMGWFDTVKRGEDIELHLQKVDPDPFTVVLVDGQERPIVGARVRIEIRALTEEVKHAGGGSSVSTGFVYYLREVLEGSPLDSLLYAITDDHGEVSFRGFSPSSWLRFAVTTRDGHGMRVKAKSQAEGAIGKIMHQQGFVTAEAGHVTRLVASPAARVQGRVITKLPGVSVAGLKVGYQASRPWQDQSPYQSNFGGVTRTDAAGRFTFDGLCEGTINIYASENETDLPWTYRAAQDVELRPGWTKAAIIELIRGVEVEGRVLSAATEEPVKGAQLGVYGPFRPRSGAATLGATTDSQGRFRYRLPPGETYFYVMGHPPGHADKTVVIPEGVDRFEIPPIVPGYMLVVGGRILDATGSPVAGATVSCIGEEGPIFDGVDAVTDSKGAFQLLPSPNNGVAVGRAAQLRIRLRDGSQQEATAFPAADGSVTIWLDKPPRRPARK
jgi:protocatechuate 3,4-dioxygenase beta subunit